MTEPRESLFARSGLAALSDLSSPEWGEIFTPLEREQAMFLKHESSFRSPDYIWPRDPLHTWSRAWEYPYVFHHLQALREARNRSDIARIVDLGSGVTFFPFAVAKLGFDVVCTDVDRVCEKDLGRAVAVVDHSPGTVTFRLTDGTHLPFNDSEIDAFYCVSVLEHVANFECLIRETARVLKLGGLFLLTVDIDLRGDMELGAENHRRLVTVLRRYFEHRWPETTIHPADMLNSSSGPYGHRPPESVWARRLFLFKQQAKTLLGMKPRPLLPFWLAIHAFALVRKQ